MLKCFLFKNVIIIRIFCILILLVYYLCFNDLLLCEDHPINDNSNDSDNLNKDYNSFYEDFENKRK